MTRRRQRSVSLSDESDERNELLKKSKKRHKERDYAEEERDSRKDSSKSKREKEKNMNQSFEEKEISKRRNRHDSDEEDPKTHYRHDSGEKGPRKGNRHDSKERDDRRKIQRDSQEKDGRQKNRHDSQEKDKYDRRQQKNYSPKRQFENDQNSHRYSEIRKEHYSKNKKRTKNDDESGSESDETQQKNLRNRHERPFRDERDSEFYDRRRNRDKVNEVNDKRRNQDRDNEFNDRRRNQDRDKEFNDRRRNQDRDKEFNDRRRNQDRDGEFERNRDRSPINRRQDFLNRRNREEPNVEEKEPDSETPASKIKINTVNLKTGGAYIPPAKLKMLRDQIADKNSEQYQRLAWEALKKSLTGLTNKVNISNIKEVVFEIFKENVIRGRGVLTRAIIQAQALSPTFTHVYAALVSIINSKFPNISELLLKRLLVQFKRGFRRNDKQMCISSTRFIAHLLNQQVAHEVVVLEMLTLLLENPTDDSVEIAIAMLKECGKKLTHLCPKGVFAIFERLKHILNEANLDKRVQYMIEVMFAVRKDKFKDYDDVPEELDLIAEEDKFTHLITLEEAKDTEDILNVFQYDPEYLKHEDWYKEIQKDILESDSESGESGSSGDESSSDDEETEENKDGETTVITDMTETNLVALRRNIYLTIQSSLDFEECAHKLLKMELNPGQIVEMCYMILDCCAQQRTYEKFFGLLAQRFCQLNKIYVEPFTDIFKNSYETIHRLETNKLRNVAKFFAHLLYTDAISWIVLSNIKLNEDDTTSSSRIFIKILFQDLAEFMGLTKLFDRVKDVTLQEAFDGLFPRDNTKNTRFAINFFTSIGLGGLTDELREHLKGIPKKSAVEEPAINVEDSSSTSSSTSSDSSSSSSSSTSSSSESEDSDDKRKKHRRKKTTSHSRKKKK